MDSQNDVTNFGEYSCIIQDSKYIEQMISAKNKQDFITNRFKIAELDWQIIFYPNGSKQNNTGSFMVYLKLLSLPKSWKNIIVCRRISCTEFESSAPAVVEYTKNKSNGWDKGTLKLSELQEMQPQKLIFKIYIRILKINSIDNEILFQDDHIGASKLTEAQSFQWKIDQNLMHKMQTSYYSKCFESPIFQNQWCLRYVLLYFMSLHIVCINLCIYV